MAFVKLDTGILNSTTWYDKPVRDVFITALLMATPHYTTEESPVLEVNSLDPVGWSVPPGWYGLVDAAGPAIVARAGLVDWEVGLRALERLAAKDLNSRSQAFDGRRLVRVDGGFLVLNYDKYREKDHTARDRARRYRDRQKASHRGSVTVTGDDRDGSRKTVTDAVTVTQAEAEAEAEVKEKVEKEKRPPRKRGSTQKTSTGEEVFGLAWQLYPKRSGSNSRAGALTRWNSSIKRGASPEELLAGTKRYRDFCDATEKTGTEYVLQGETFFGPKEHWREEWSLPNTAMNSEANKAFDRLRNHVAKLRMGIQSPEMAKVWQNLSPATAAGVRAAGGMDKVISDNPKIAQNARSRFVEAYTSPQAAPVDSTPKPVAGLGTVAELVKSV